MSSITFDSYPIYTELKDAGFNEPQAKAMVNTFKRVYEDANLATKSDIKRAAQRVAPRDARNALSNNY